MCSSFVGAQIVGPMADDPTAIFGTYTAHPDRRFVTTPVDGLSRLSVDTRHAAGCDNAACLNYNADDVRTAVSGAQFVVVCLGLGTGSALFTYLQLLGFIGR